MSEEAKEDGTGARRQEAALRGVQEALERLWERPQLSDLAEPIRPVATWDDLVLPEEQMRALRQVAVHVRKQDEVYGGWGFARHPSRRPGTTALFAGPSGTGKTLAAEVLATELELDLYRIDLSAVISKYIGETEKNLRRVFDTAEKSGAILLFENADAFLGRSGKRKDRGARVADLEVSYLLQRMESYGGLAVLTTRQEDALAPSLRWRVRILVRFPFPDAAARAQIWRSIFPAATPTEGLDADKLARFELAGGNILSVATNAAFLACAAGEPVRMSHLQEAATSEVAKLGKPVPSKRWG